MWRVESATVYDVTTLHSAQRCPGSLVQHYIVHELLLIKTSVCFGIISLLYF